MEYKNLEEQTQDCEHFAWSDLTELKYSELDEWDKGFVKIILIHIVLFTVVFILLTLNPYV